MTPIAVSVIVVSHGRPDALPRCLTGLAQQDYPAMEIVVVADTAGLNAVRRHPLADHIRTARCDRANISAARNIGLAMAAGPIVAFIDDDAVPEPTWLTHLTAPFADPDIAAAGGFVLARNGISLQWGARMVFADGRTADLPVSVDDPFIVTGAAGRAAKTEGTNMAFRRDVLIGIGGFDEAFAFYLDETDVNMRLAAKDAKTAIVPLAQVHHGFAAGARRRPDRVPRDLTQIGASLAVFARKHGPTDHPGARIARHEQRLRLLRHMVAGRLLPGDVHGLMQGFDAGWQDGLKRTTGQHPTFDANNTFQPLPTRVRSHKVLNGRFWQSANLHRVAAALVRDGFIVSLYLWSFTARSHRVRFTDDGVWCQTGGQFGKSDRRDPPFRAWTARRRVAREVARTAPVRVPSTPDSAGS